MRMTRLRGFSALAACGALAWSMMALSADRTADKILAEIDAITVPSADSVKEPAEVTKRLKLADQKAKLILELYKASPTNPGLVRLMPERWQLRPTTVASNQTTKSEITEILSKSKNPKLVAEAAYYKANLAIKSSSGTVRLDEVLPSIEDFAKRFPKDERVPQLIFLAASSATDKARKTELLARVAKDYPDSPAAKKLAEKASSGSIPEDVKEMIGAPFVLEFTDAIKGSTISVQGLKGKVVVIDFWATWCPPCVAEMPNMKKLYAEFKDKGVEFIGVSLDQSKEQGGLDALKSFVAKNQIEWPQYYQGKFWNGEFSSAWHINSIPRVFLVDTEGKLASINARGQLEKLIPQYLGKTGEKTAEKGKKKAPGAATSTAAGPSAN
jgi:thiol-disulfide isomerase/thioredoxin